VFQGIGIGAPKNKMATNYDFLNTLAKLRDVTTTSSPEFKATIQAIDGLLDKYFPAYPELEESWNKMMTANADERDKNAICMLVLPKHELRDIVRKLKKKTEHKIKFPGDDFITTFRMQGDKVMAFEPKYPDGREVGTTERLTEKGTPSEFKPLTPRGWLYSLLRDYHPTLTDTDITRVGYSIWTNIDTMPAGHTETLAYMLAGLFIRLTAVHDVRLSFFDATSDCALLFSKDVDVGIRKDILTLLHIACL